MVFSAIPRIIDVVLKIILLLVAMFFGKIALAGWGGKLDFITKTGVTIVLGIICFTVGVLLPFDFFPQIPFISHAINAFIAAVFLFVILFLLSEKRRKPQFLTKGDIESLKNDIDFLKSELTRINQTLIKKGIQAKPVSKEKVESIVGDILKSKNIKKYSIISTKQEGNFWESVIKTDSKKYKVKIDSYGQLKEFNRIGLDISRITERLKEDKLFLTGSVMALIFLVVVVSLMTPQNIQRVSETFSLYGVDLVSPDCLTPAMSLEIWNQKESRVYEYSYTFSRVNNSIMNYLDDEIYVSEFLPGIHILVENEEVYGIFLASEEKIRTQVDLVSAIRSNSKICSVGLESYEVCSCVDITDPRTSVHILEILEEIASDLI